VEQVAAEAEPEAGVVAVPGPGVGHVHQVTVDEALMNGWSALDRFLQTDPRDVGCAEAMDLLHVYAELAAADASAAERYPGIAAHLRACGPCGVDFDGLLAALRCAAD
jgi:hypothetical protein